MERMRVVSILLCLILGCAGVSGDSDAQVCQEASTPQVLAHLMQQLDTTLVKAMDDWEKRLARLDDKIESLYGRLDDKIKSMSGRLTGLGDKIESNSERLTGLDDKKEAMSGRLTGLDNKMDSLSGRLDNGITSLSHHMDDDIKFLEKLIEDNIAPGAQAECIKDTDAEIRQELGVLNACIDNVKAVITDYLEAHGCVRDIAKVLHLMPPAYVLIPMEDANSKQVPQYCDTFTDGGGWILIQRRTTGKTNFYLDWIDYQNGFGTFEHDFWLGLDEIHDLTSSGEYELRVDLRYDGRPAYAHYGNFSVAGEDDNYRLSLGPFLGGSAGDSLSMYNGMMFSTRDRDNDMGLGNCAATFRGAWWCHGHTDSNLNSERGQVWYKSPRWSTFSSTDPVSFSEMKIRRVV